MHQIRPEGGEEPLELFTWGFPPRRDPLRKCDSSQDEREQQRQKADPHHNPRARAFLPATSPLLTARPQRPRKDDL